jgi:hypothetical protein
MTTNLWTALAAIAGIASGLVSFWRAHISNRLTWPFRPIAANTEDDLVEEVAARSVEAREGYIGTNLQFTAAGLAFVAAGLALHALVVVEIGAGIGLGALAGALAGQFYRPERLRQFAVLLELERMRRVSNLDDTAAAQRLKDDPTSLPQNDQVIDKVIKWRRRAIAHLRRERDELCARRWLCTPRHFQHESLRLIVPAF